MSVVKMAEKISICREINSCPVGKDLYRCCETCNEECAKRRICKRTDCSGLVVGDQRNLLDVRMDDMSRVLSAIIEELDNIPSNSELDYSWKENFVHGLEVPEKLKEKLITPPNRYW